MELHNSKQITRDLNTGFSEGLIITFTVIAGLFGAELEPAIIQITSTAVALFGALAFAIARYATEKTASRDFHSEETHGAMQPHTLNMLAELGFSKDFRDTAINEMARDQEEWVRNIEASSIKAQARNSPAVYPALAIAISFFVAGFIALMPVLFIKPIGRSVVLSAGLVALALIAAGAWRAALLGRNKFAGAGIRLALGFATAGSAFLAARLIIA